MLINEKIVLLFNCFAFVALEKKRGGGGGIFPELNLHVFCVFLLNKHPL